MQYFDMDSVPYYPQIYNLETGRDQRPLLEAMCLQPPCPEYQDSQ